MEIHIQKDKRDKLVDPQTAELGHGANYHVYWHNSNDDTASITIDQGTWTNVFSDPYPTMPITVTTQSDSPKFALKRQPERVDGKYPYTVVAGDQRDDSCVLDTTHH